ncbi:MurR/RpiR family transcriptional regulator [Paenibacillus sp. GCM10027626]|uniref:MurR/RpiR family transcriptional regulator n=1 Tax=Paenibacillus sp. GCM10027626 TaxID=3273411 RepID=UPI00362B68A9
MKQVRKLSSISNTLLMITSIYNSLTKAEKKVADAVLRDPEEAVLATVTDLAEKAAVGETSVIRFCRKLGFHGYHEFKLAIAQDLVTAPTHISGGHIDDGDDSATIVGKITANNVQMLQDAMDFIDVDALNDAVRLLLGGERILIYGVGSSGITALDAHYRFMRLGLNVEIQRDAHIIAMSAALVRNGDIVFGISTSGSTKDLVDPIKQAKQNGAKIICLTSHAKSPITTYADTVLLSPSKESPYQGGALSTKIAQIHIIEVLSNLIMMEKKEAAFDSIKKTASAVASKLY